MFRAQQIPASGVSSPKFLLLADSESPPKHLDTDDLSVRVGVRRRLIEKLQPASLSKSVELGPPPGACEGGGRSRRANRGPGERFHFSSLSAVTYPKWQSAVRRRRSQAAREDK
ncbi:unnamed protein product [Pleuronectes platessa]|uniref:Uncharacterized protein n=1 Tax=Pleuronectes platessa TaxID=8262 RepID=A0A9N7VEE1_PLEPL|nr:unnamed protein product [Pleuronectes platessa]